MLEDRLFKRHLEDDEIVSRIVHRHWLVGTKMLWLPAVSLLISLVFLVLVLPSKVFGIVGLVWLLGSAVWLLGNFFDYYLDAWIITDRGVIDLAWYGWFHRQSTRILYSDIQGVSYEIKGLIGTVMKYGTVTIEKISTGGGINLESVKQPRDVEALVLKNMESYLHSKNMKNAKQVQELLSTFIAEHMQADAVKPKLSGKVQEKETNEANETKEKEETKKPKLRKRVTTRKSA